MLRLYAESVGVGASLVSAQATRRIQPVESYEGNHKGCPYNVQRQLTTGIKNHALLKCLSIHRGTVSC